jgi:Replication protein P.
MEQVGKVLARINGRNASGGDVPPNMDDAAVRVVNALIKELKAIFPAWRQAWPDDDSLQMYKRAMVKGFVQSGIFKIEQIKFGVQACRQLPTDFVPSVGRFIALCQPTPELLGLPSEDDAYAEAARNAYPNAGQVVWSHPAVSHAAREVGTYNLSTMPLKSSRMLFSRAYAIVCRMLANGEPLKPILIGLPEKAEGRRTPEVGKAALDKLRGAMRGEPTDD